MGGTPVYSVLHRKTKGTRMIKSNTPVACWRRGLDRAEPLFSPTPGRKRKRVPGEPPKSRYPFGVPAFYMERQRGLERPLRKQSGGLFLGRGRGIGVPFLYGKAKESPENCRPPAVRWASVGCRFAPEGAVAQQGNECLPSADNPNAFSGKYYPNVPEIYPI